MPDELDQPLTIPAAIDRAARLFTTRSAYVEGGGAGGRHSLTWGELARRVHETAAGLVALGLQRGDRAAISAENGIDWVVAYLAATMAGAAGVLVYFELKPSELRDQINRPGSRFLFASESVLAKLPETETVVEKIIVLGPTAGASTSHLPFEKVALAATATSREALTARAPAPDDLAAIIYTSGTTGGAKGVMLSHRNLLANANSARAAFDFTADDSVLLVLPLHHAMPFLATVVLVSLIGAKVMMENDLRRIRDRLQEQRPTVFFGVPALYDLMYRNILARAESEGRLEQMQAWQKRLQRIKQLTGLNLGHLVFKPVHKALGGRLRFLVSGGAALNPATARAFFSLGLPLLQGWGMTEAGPVIAVQRFSQQRFRFTRYYEQHVGSVGPPLPDVEVRLIDVPEKEIRVGVSGEGEVIVRGANVFQGYWQAEEATHDAKLDGWLRTGDLARIDSDGNIYLTGRSKYIIVLESGEKVHPDELEEKLAESDVIEDICITGRDLRGKTQVTAIIYPRLDGLQARSGDALDEAAVQRIVSAEVERLGRQLAAYKRVSRIELTDTPLPKTPLRKVARGQLADAYEFDFERWLASADEGATAP
jgi:long-chain acyl-CoA synthetase